MPYLQNSIRCHNERAIKLIVRNSINPKTVFAPKNGFVLRSQLRDVSNFLIPNPFLQNWVRFCE
jgi:hypothetical protein